MMGDAVATASRAAPRCAATRGERIGRGFASVFVGAFAVSTLDNPWCAVPAAICSVLLMVGAVTGWCPTDLLRAGSGWRSGSGAPSSDPAAGTPTFDYPVAPEPVRVPSR
ncbi:hypothetical protein AB2L57_04825 [Microbacterium sp. HA-8]|uniref:hypothetical protein n=1 Tax=unclassified Microbacterium TaxID=2609290 RepID=UPI0026013357|nr:hypothetical protein [Microbacterium sp.]